MIVPWVETSVESEANSRVVSGESRERAGEGESRKKNGGGKKLMGK